MWRSARVLVHLRANFWPILNFLECNDVLSVLWRRTYGARQACAMCLNVGAFLWTMTSGHIACMLQESKDQITVFSVGLQFSIIENIGLHQGVL